MRCRNLRRGNFILMPHKLEGFRKSGRRRNQIDLSSGYSLAGGTCAPFMKREHVPFGNSTVNLG